MVYLRKIIILLIVFFFVTGCSQAKSPSPIKELQQLTNLYISLSKIAKNRHVAPIVKQIEGSPAKQKIAIISTRTVDNYVLQTKKEWLKICDSLLNYTYNNDLGVLEDDALFGSLLASVSLSQADTYYSAKTINIAKKILLVYSNVELEGSTIEILGEAPALKWIFDSFSLERSQGIVSPERDYIARLLIVEYIRVGDTEGAYSMLNKLSEYNTREELITELRNYVTTADTIVKKK